MSSEDKKKTLTDADITTDHPTNRRTVLGVMGAAGVGAALIPTGAEAQGTDSDNGSWTDAAGCGRGSGGYSTGITDADNGSLGTDAPGRGRGAPYC
ncbi:hypothetical protein [Gymnodinialimonas sp.]